MSAEETAEAGRAMRRWLRVTMGDTGVVWRIGAASAVTLMVLSLPLAAWVSWVVAMPVWLTVLVCFGVTWLGEALDDDRRARELRHAHHHLGGG